MGPFDWRPASHEDCPALQSFCCTFPDVLRREPRYERTPPRPAEAEAQAIIRRLNPGKARRSGQHILTAHDAEGLAAVSAWKPEGPNRAHIQVMGVAMRLRRTGDCTLSDELMLRTLHGCLDGCGSPVLVTALIDRTNSASRALAERSEFEPFEEWDEHYDLWRIEVS